MCARERERERGMLLNFLIFGTNLTPQITRSLCEFVCHQVLVVVHVYY